jgi:hypothetical protein
MVTKRIDVNKVQSLEDLLSQLDEETELVLLRGDKAIARLSSEPEQAPRKKRKAGLHDGEMWMADDFNAELPDSFWLGEE